MVSDIQRLYYKGRFIHNKQVNPDLVLLSKLLELRQTHVMIQQRLMKS